VDAMLIRLSDADRRKALDGLALLASAAREFISSNQFREAIRSVPV
jgi:hypothetical protein